ncbi:MAG: DNA-binding response regulator [Gemmatimonadetes bacterium]|nr:DNA-binding response regulator [Gemmatimonadota bacterium]
MSRLKECSVERGFEQLRVLIVDDEADVRLGLRLLVTSLGAEVREAASAEMAIEVLRGWAPHLLLSDVTMGEMSGMELLERVRRDRPEIQVLMITGYGTIELAVEAMRRGAAHFITKPFDNREILEEVARHGCDALVAERVRRMNTAGEGEPSRIIAEDPSMVEVLELARQIGPTSMPVLIRGESGSGKSLVARLIHESSRDPSLPFTHVRLAALSESAIESELFGHVAGALPGANEDRKGVLARATGGTVYLDRITALPPLAQGKLLQALQEECAIPLGSTTPEPVEFRIVAATDQHLHERIAEKAFRKDLYFRLRVVTLDVPPLKDRPGDIVPLADHFLSLYSTDARDAGDLSEGALDALRAHDWPGNARELENSIRRAVVLARGETIRTQHLRLSDESDPWFTVDAEGLSYEDGKQQVLQAFQRRIAERSLRVTAGNVTRAAELCGLTRAAFQRIMRTLDLDRNEFVEDR